MRSTVGEGWADRKRAIEVLGISGPALLLLQRDRVLPPDCALCGRIRWREDELRARREEVRAYLARTYPDSKDDLLHSVQ